MPLARQRPLGSPLPRALIRTRMSPGDPTAGAGSYDITSGAHVSGSSGSSSSGVGSSGSTALAGRRGREESGAEPPPPPPPAEARRRARLLAWS
eukprot:1588889-Pyramimonas_sp.AAC.1